MSTEQTLKTESTANVAQEQPAQECQHAEVLQKATMDWLMHDVIGQRPTTSGIILVVVLLMGVFLSRRFK